MTTVCSCGHPFDVGDRFCADCGLPRPAGVPVAPPAHGAAAPPWSAPGQSPPPAGWRPPAWAPRPLPGAAGARRPRPVALMAAAASTVVVAVTAFAVAFHAAATPDPGRLVPVSLTTPTPSVTAQPLADVALAVRSRVVTIETQAPDHEELGTGWLLDGRGDFVTNAHVVEGAIGVRIRDFRDHTFVGAVMGVDREQDVAVVRAVEGFTGPALTPGPDGDPPLPDDVVVLASSRATGHGWQTDGVIARLHQDVPVRGNGDVDPGGTSATVLYHDMMALRARIYPGNSGGPVLDGYERVVGIVTLASRSAPQAYAIPLPRVLPELRAFAARATPPGG